jgi:RNA polymerase sigma-70 factor (ECF subfamily)
MAEGSYKAAKEAITTKANSVERQAMQPSNEQISDKDLLEKFQDENSRNFAFNQIVRKYEVKIYHLIRKMVIDHEDAHDLTQETFIKVWNNLLNFKQQSQLYTWIYRIAVNESLGFLGSKRRKFFLPINDISKELTQKLDNGGFTGDEIQLKLQKALLKLPDKQRLVFNMRFYDDMSYEQISEIVGTSVGALKASYHHAAKKIELYVQE